MKRQTAPGTYRIPSAGSAVEKWVPRTLVPTSSCGAKNRSRSSIPTSRPADTAITIAVSRAMAFRRSGKARCALKCRDLPHVGNLTALLVFRGQIVSHGVSERGSHIPARKPSQRLHLGNVGGQPVGVLVSVPVKLLPAHLHNAGLARRPRELLIE